MAQADGQLNSHEVKNFLTLPQEQLIFAQRQHWWVLISPIFLSFLLGIISITVVYFFFVALFSHIPLFILSVLLISVITLSLVCKFIIDWYCHFYIITNRKFLEVSCAPFFSDNLNDVLLDQVRITSVDVRMDSFIDEIFNKGDIVILFDRPSYDKEFRLSEIAQPRNTGIYLGDALEETMHEAPIWFKPRRSAEIYGYTEDVFQPKVI